MRYVDAKMFSGWIIVGVAMVIPFAVGCGSKTDSRQETSPASEGQPSEGQTSAGQPTADQATADQATADPRPLAVPTVELGSGADGSARPRSPGRVDHAEDPSDAVLREVVADDAGSPDADRPRSLFRSIGRAVGKGITDAVGGTSDESSAPGDSAEAAPADPR